MSRLYGRLQGNRAEVTRTGHNRMIAEIRYNFDGGNYEVGSMKLVAEVLENKTISFSLISIDSPNAELLGEWEFSPRRS